MEVYRNKNSPVFFWMDVEGEESSEEQNFLLLAQGDSDSTWKKSITDSLLARFLSERRIDVDENVNEFSVVLKAYQENGTRDYENQHYWRYTKIVFHTEQSEQTLQIVMYSPQTDNGVSRFHLHDIDEESHKLDVIDDIIEYSLNDDPAGPWHKQKKDAEFPHHTKRVKLKLHLPGDEEQYFALKMRAKDIRDAFPFKCDPQVGNDPPQPDI